MISDLQLQHQVAQELEWEPGVDAARVGVTARDGVITLTGTVRTYLEKLAAERAAKRVFGVRGIANDVGVALAHDGKRSDSDIARAAVQALDWNAAIPRSAVHVTVIEGHVRLEGSVPYYYQRLSAEGSVDHLLGVKDVTNLIAIKPAATVTDLTSRIQAAFERSADIDAHRVKVAANGGAVTLTGQVRSWAERNAAERAAWAAPGVTEVRDDLAVGV